MRYLSVICMSFLLVAAGSVAARADDENALATEILKTTGIQGGLIVHLGCGEGKLAVALRAANDSLQVHGLDRDGANVQQARQHALASGVYGSVSIDRLTGKRLPYVDNLVNLVIQHDEDAASTNEVSRVLVPGGVRYLRTAKGWALSAKPRPNNIDEWTHYLHDASGNAVAHDDAVGPPRHLQWLGSPRWSRHHDRMASLSAMVSAGGRVFYIMDEGSRVSIQLPPKWKLIARDAFNGSVLWKQPIATWHSHLWPLKSGPTQLARRLVATGGEVYATLGFEAPLTALDAATGKVLRTYKDTKSTEEIIASDGKLFVVVNKNPLELTAYAPQLNVGDQQRVGKEFQWDEKPREIVALEAASGSELWRKKTRIAPLTLAADAKRVYFHDGDKVVCLNRTAGKEIWSSPPAARRDRVNFNFGPKLVIYKDVVLFAGGDRKMTAYAADSGKQLWSAPHDQSAYASPEDLLVAGGLVWSAPTTRTGDSGVFTGRDPRTGEVKTSFPPNVKTYWFHHRCHMAKATDKFLLPSRTGIEFVDPEKKNWDINHWVRGGCLYGIMPCNGLVYAPPHNCACYPEAKLYGLNALAPASATRKVPKEIAEEGRLERGPVYGEDFLQNPGPAPGGWETYRANPQRSGYVAQAVKAPSDLQRSWETTLSGRLSAITVDERYLYVAEVDRHTVHALDRQTGKKVWSYTVGGRVDSPPTSHWGYVLFGSADGYVYCLDRAKGRLLWRFRAAPRDERLMAYEQLESVWPVHGSVLVQDNLAYFVAGRSNYLDGGLRLLRLNVFTGKKLSETVIDERDPETGKNLQERLAILNMPVGLPDVLSSDGKQVYMRSQQFDPQGNRIALGPHSAQPAEQGSVQRGSTAHLFAPMGFLDDTWFHRSYWVYGRSFAGGHAGYFQAGKYAPSGRILVHDDENVYGFGRKEQYYRWTTTMEHQLFCASKQPPEEARAAVDEKTKKAGGSAAATMIRVAKSKSLNPAGQAVTVEAWANSEQNGGVVLAHGGPTQGYALVVQNSRPRFVVRIDGKIYAAAAKGEIVGAWTHLVGMLTAEKQLQLYVNGKLAARGKSPSLLTADPAQALQIGGDEGGSVGNYRSPLGFSGAIDEVAVYHGTLTAQEVADHFANPGKRDAKTAKLVLAYSFGKGKAADESGNANDGTLAGAKVTLGKVGRGMRFAGRPSRAGGSFVKHKWAQDLPLLVRAMVLADKTLFIAGPPDLIDEEETFARLVKRDKKVLAQLAQQDAALAGKQGALLQAISATDGKKLAEYRLDSLPTWDGLAAAYGRLYLSTTDGKVVCFSKGE